MYTLSPSGVYAQQVLNIQAERVKKSIESLINECINKFQIKDNTFAIVISKIVNAIHLPCELHFLHHMLQTAMKNHDVKSVKLYLEKIVIFAYRQPNENQGISITSIGNTEWEEFVVKEAISLTEINCEKSVEIKPILDDELRLAKDALAMALSIIEKYDSDMFDELQEHVKLIKLFKGKTIMGHADVRILGTMLLCLPNKNSDPILYFIEHIVHEASRMHLKCLMMDDPLILNSPNEQFIATFASARTARTFMKIYRYRRNENTIPLVAEAMDKTTRGLDEIKRSAKLTPQGSQLFASISHFLEAAATGSGVTAT
jgi:hypothetical protein